MKNLHPGALVDGIVIDIHKFGARIKIKETDISGLLHISKIARARIHDIRDIFSIGEQVKVMVVKSPIKNGIAFRYLSLTHMLIAIVAQNSLISMVPLHTS
jgi:ribosomal protein S1